MSNLGNIRSWAATLQDCVLEALWPTRCTVCDRPGSLLCNTCLRALPYLDPWLACPVCGAAFGRMQCTECTLLTLQRNGMESLPFASCTSALRFTAQSARIPRAFKDHGARGLAPVMAGLMQNALCPEWTKERPCVTFVPATAAAVQRRGFDHMEELATALACTLGLTCRTLLPRPRSTDQRGLSRAQRFANMRQVFAATGLDERSTNMHQEDLAAPAPPHVLLVDDVMTTGATLFAAASALQARGAQTVRCLTFLRV